MVYHLVEESLQGRRYDGLLVLLRGLPSGIRIRQVAGLANSLAYRARAGLDIWLNRWHINFMDIKAFVLVPEREATNGFLEKFPHDTAIAIVPDDEFHEFIGRYNDKQKGEEFDPEPMTEEEDLLGDPHEAGC